MILWWYYYFRSRWSGLGLVSSDLFNISDQVHSSLGLYYMFLCHCSGGVLTPGAAFAETNLMDRLESHGVHFATVEN